MDNYSFILSFITAFAVGFLVVSIIVAFLKPSNWKILKKALIGLTIIIIIGADYNFYINLFLSSAFLIYGIKLFIQAINYRAKQEAIKDYNKKIVEMKYDLNDAIERINLVINFLIVLIVIFLGIFFTSGSVSFFIGIGFLFIFIRIMINYFIHARIKDTAKFDADSIKANLYTLISLTLTFSVMLFLALLLIPFNNDLQNQIKLYPIFAFIMVLPLVLVSDYFLGYLRMTFFENHKINEYFISNLLKYTITSLIFIILLSDVTVAYSIIKSQNYENMMIWTFGFVFFIGNCFLIIIKKSYLYKLESRLMTIKDIS